MKIDEFLKQFIDGYLFRDLENMATLGPLKGHSCGAAGYPMVSATVSGIEMLGALTMPKGTAYKTNKSNDYFDNFWTNYLEDEYPEYRGLNDIFRELVRNGLNHVFLAKVGVVVEKSNKPRRTSINSKNNKLYIDAVVFYEQVENTYLNRIIPLLSDDGGKINRNTMQSMLDQILIFFQRDTEDAFNKIKKEGIPKSVYDLSSRRSSPSFSIRSDVRTSGASLSAIPISGINATGMKTKTTNPILQEIFDKGKRPDYSYNKEKND